MLDKKNKVFTFILFFLPLGAMAQTVDLEKDSLLVNLPYGNVLNVLASSDKFQSMPTFRTMKLGVNLLF